MPRRGYGGAVAGTSLAADVTAASTSLTVVDASTWVGVTANGPATATLARGTTGEERVTFTGVSGNSLTGVTRGVDGTAAVSHLTGVAVEHTSAAFDFDDANDHIYDPTRDDHTQYHNNARGDARYPTIAGLAGKGYMWTASAAGVLVPLAPGADFTRLRSRAGATNGVEWAAVAPAAVVATSEAVTGTSYGDPPTAGPTVGPITTGTSVLLLLGASIQQSTSGAYAFMGFAVSGASTLAADDTRATYLRAAAANDASGIGRLVVVTGLTAGSNTFTAKYKVSAGTGTFADRHMAVIPL